MSLAMAAGCATGGDESSAERAEPVSAAPIEPVATTDEVATSPTTQPPSDVPSAGDVEVLELGASDLDEDCRAGELCVTVTATETTGQDLRLLLYEATADTWPQDYRSCPPRAGS